MATDNPIGVGDFVGTDYLNALDQLMARDITNGVPGWVPSPDAYVYVSASSFKVVGLDVTKRFSVGTKISLTDAAATKYFYVVSSAFSSDTTVTITGGADYSLAGGAITNPRYSHIANPYGFPSSFALTSAASLPYTGWSATPTLSCYMNVTSRLLTFWYNIAGTSTAGATTVTLPFAVPAGFPSQVLNLCRATDNTATTAVGVVNLVPSSAVVTFYKDIVPNVFTTSGTKQVLGLFQLPI